MKSLLVATISLLLFSFNILAQNCEQVDFVAAPTGLEVVADWASNPPQIVFSWDAYPNATACMIVGKTDMMTKSVAVMVGDMSAAAPNTYSVPALAFWPDICSTGLTFEWKVVCGCSVTPLVASPFSATNVKYFAPMGCE